MVGGTLRSSTDFTYADKTNYLTGIKHYSALGTQNIGYRYGNLSAGEMPDQIYSVSWNGNEKVSYTYDALGRLTNKKIAAFNNLYSYKDVDESRTTTLVNSVQTPAGTYTYTYDGIGNILSTTDGTYTTSYEYDSLNQLTRVNDEKSGKTYTYSYSNGNITEQKEYAYTTDELGEAVDTKTWSYGNSTWSDLLTSYNGEQIVYDEIGNPLTIGNKELSWLGRQLLGITEGESTVSYTYNGDGQRISKTVNGVNTEYIYNGEILAGQKTGNDIIVFMYDNNSDAFGFIYNSTEYYYVKNAQNDVTAIADSNGNVLARYYYDAWGKVREITGNTEIASLNPIRYRSYYYDTETGWYYLNTRYYSADMCRFINADGYIQTGQGVLDKNMFAYCLNNPINKKDVNGNISGLAIAYIASKILIYAIVAIIICEIAATALVPTIQKSSNALSDSISSSVSKAKAKAQERKKNRDNEPRKHHMVAKAAWRAEPARKILQEVGMNPTNAPENLIVISHGLHKNMHTKNYYDYVNAKLAPHAGNLDEINQALLEIREDILYAEATGIRRWEIS